jgi:hypothetical protein
MTTTTWVAPTRSVSASGLGTEAPAGSESADQVPYVMSHPTGDATVDRLANLRLSGIAVEPEKSHPHIQSENVNLMLARSQTRRAEIYISSRMSAPSRKSKRHVTLRRDGNLWLGDHLLPRLCTPRNLIDFLPYSLVVLPLPHSSEHPHFLLPISLKRSHHAAKPHLQQISRQLHLVFKKQAPQPFKLAYQPRQGL